MGALRRINEQQSKILSDGYTVIMQSTFKKQKNTEISGRNTGELEHSKLLYDLHLSLLTHFGESWNQHSLVTMQRQTLSRILHYHEIYKEILDVPGVILEFGVQWGATLAQLIAFRGLYEPFNYRRHIFGFDTFSGFENINAEKDGVGLNQGDYKVYENYENSLEQILSLHEANCPIDHLKKFTLIKGDASKTVNEWSVENPNALVALSIFDMDVYQPTVDALTAVLPRLTKGSVLVFDELNSPQFKGEFKAVSEIINVNEHCFHQNPHQPNAVWVKWQ